MDIKEREEFAKKLDQLTDEDKYEEILAIYDAIPKEEWDLKMKVDYAKTLNNKAMYAYEEGDPKRVSLIGEAISYLLDIQDEGKFDAYWNWRLGMAYYAMGHSTKEGYLEWYTNAHTHFGLAQMMDEENFLDDVEYVLFECRTNIINYHIDHKEYKAAFELLDRMPEAVERYEEMDLHALPASHPHAFNIDEDYVAPTLPEKLAEDIKTIQEAAGVLVDEKRLGEALDLLYEAILMAPQPRNVYAEVALTETLIGMIFLWQEKYLNASIIYFIAFTNASHYGYSEHCLMNLAYSFFKLGDWKRATTFLEAMGEVGDKVDMSQAVVEDEEFKNFIEASAFMDKLDKDSD